MHEMEPIEQTALINVNFMQIHFSDNATDARCFDWPPIKKRHRQFSSFNIDDIMGNNSQNSQRETQKISNSKNLPWKSSPRSVFRPCMATPASPAAYSLSVLAFCNRHRFIVSNRRISASCRESKASCAALPCSADENPMFAIHSPHNTILDTVGARTHSKLLYYSNWCHNVWPLQTVNCAYLSFANSRGNALNSLSMTSMGHPFFSSSSGWRTIIKSFNTLALSSQLGMQKLVPQCQRLIAHQ